MRGMHTIKTEDFCGATVLARKKSKESSSTMSISTDMLHDTSTASLIPMYCLTMPQSHPRPVSAMQHDPLHTDMLETDFRRSSSMAGSSTTCSVPWLWKQTPSA